MKKCHTPKTLRNGFEAVTREQIADFACTAMDEAGNLRTILAAITRLATKETGEIKALAAMGKNIAELLHNDIDVIGECAEKAGLVGELVEEGGAP